MTKIILLASLTIILASCSHTQFKNKTTVSLQSKSNSKVTGIINVFESEDSIKVIATVKGLKPNSEHGFHIHQKGDCSSKDGKSAGGHYSPVASKHGAPEAMNHHLGDLGNLASDANGTATKEIIIEKLNISKGNNFSVSGKAFIVHNDKDDMTSQPSGNAGARVACGVIR